MSLLGKISDETAEALSSQSRRLLHKYSLRDTINGGEVSEIIMSGKDAEALMNMIRDGVELTVHE